MFFGFDLAGDGGCEEAEEVSEEGAVEVWEPVPARGEGDPLLSQPGRLRLLVRVIPAQQRIVITGLPDPDA